MAEAPKHITVQVRFQFAQGHDDPETVPGWMCDEFPTQVLGYVANGYLAGVEVGRRSLCGQLGEMYDDLAAQARADGQDGAEAAYATAAAIARGYTAPASQPGQDRKD